MTWDGLLPQAYGDERINTDMISGLLYHYYADWPEGCPTKVTSMYIKQVAKLHSQLLGMDYSDSELDDIEAAEILSNLSSNVINKPFTGGTITKILKELEKFEMRRFFYKQANESADTVYEHLNAGNAKLELGEEEEALEHYNKAISINLDFLGGYVMRARCLIALGRTEEALEDIDYLCKCPSNHIGDFYEFISAANISFQLGQHSFAVEFIIKAVGLILEHAHQAQIEKDCIVIQTERGTYYFYFKTLGELISLLRSVETLDDSKICVLSKYAKMHICDMRERIGF